MPTVDGPSPVISGGCRDGSARLLSYLCDLFDLGVSGCYNPNSLTAAGGPSYHVSGCAIDLTCNWYDFDARRRGNACFDWAVAHAEELNLQEVIFGERIRTARRWSDGTRFYAPDDHKNHVHIALGRGPADQWTPTPIVEDDMFEPVDRDRLDRVEKKLDLVLALVGHVDRMVMNVRAGFSRVADSSKDYLSMNAVGRRVRDAVDKITGP